jgi:HSP20 family protein
MGNPSLEDVMNNLIRFDPFEGSLIPELFKGLGMNRMPWPNELSVDFKVDVSENDKEYAVMAELPGVARDDIAIAVDRDLLTISAELRKDDVVREGERLIRSERFIGHLRRSFALGADVDPERVVARYADGVLHLTLPKKVPGSARRIRVC